jgi:drug/metabolite transporter (DMT)-like permease
VADAAGDDAVTPIARGVLLAVAAAAAFGVTTPLVQWCSRGADPAPTAALLYLGAALFALIPHGRSAEVRLASEWAPRILGVAVSGAFLAPLLLTAGLARTHGTTAALLLNLEAVFTVALSALVYREHVGRRVALAVLVIAGGGVLTAADHASGGGATTLVGPLMVAGATLCWAADNTLSRPLSDLDPSDVVAAKGLVGAALSLLLALALGSAWPELPKAAGIALCGAFGFGASLRLYLRAQRVLGAARTGSVFAVAPFLGVLGAAVLGEPLGGWLTLLGGLVMAAGVWLHLGEDHDHEHSHEALTHEHPHSHDGSRHDDGHHDDHVHDPPVRGVHSHVHTHAPRAHRHAHGEDLHHRHPHGDSP